MMTSVRENLFTEYEDQLTAGMPELVAVGFVNARRRDGKGEKSDKRLLVTATTVTEIPVGDFAFGHLFGHGPR